MAVSGIASTAGDPVSALISALQAAGSATYVRTVNGTGPDGSGNVVVSGGAGASSVAASIEVEGTGYPARPTAPLVVWRGWTDPTADPEFVTNVDLWSQADTPGGAVDQWFTDFSTDTTGAAPAGWTSRWGAATSNLIVDESGNKLLRVAFNGGQYFFSWDTIPDSADVEIVAKYRFAATMVTATARIIQPVGVRGAGSTGTETGYFGRVVSNAAGPLIAGTRVAKPAADIYVPVTQVAIPNYADLSWNWFRLRVNGSTISTRSWPDGQTEPATWTTSANNADISAAGKVGLGAYIFTTVDYDTIGVGINGASAPTAP